MFLERLYLPYLHSSLKKPPKLDFVKHNFTNHKNFQNSMMERIEFDRKRWRDIGFSKHCMFVHFESAASPEVKFRGNVL